MFWFIIFQLLWLNGESSKEFIITRLLRKQIVRVNEEYKVLQNYQFRPDKIVENIQARYENDKLILIWTEEGELFIRYIDTNSLMSEPNNLKFSSEKFFDLQTCGDYMVMTQTNEIQTTFSLGNFKTSKVETVLSIKPDLKTLAIHPTKRIIYYVTCRGSSYSFKVYDVDAKKEMQSFDPLQCLDGVLYDDKNDIMWAFDGDIVYKSNLKEERFEPVYQRDHGMISSVALGNKDLLIMHNGRTNTIVYSFTLKPKSSKTLSLPAFRISPSLGFVKGNFFLLDVDNQHLILYDDEFKEIWKNKITVESKPVASVNGISRADGSWEFYWIHPSNAGKMKAVFISPAGTVARENTLQFDGDIRDFTIHEKTGTIYLAKNTAIYSSKPYVSLEQQPLELFYDFKQEIKAVHSISSILMLTLCDGVKNGFSALLLSKLREPLIHETKECFEDLQTISNSPYFVSNNGIYTSGTMMQNLEKLYDIEGLRNIVTYGDHDYVYFVASPDDTGPGIYKIAGSRSKFSQQHAKPGRPKTDFVTGIKGNCETTEANDKKETQSTAADTKQITTKSNCETTEANDKKETQSTAADTKQITTKKDGGTEITVKGGKNAGEKTLKSSTAKLIWYTYGIYVAVFLALTL